MMDSVDRAIINRLQDGFPICERPFAAVANELGLAESELIERVQHLLDARILSRFGPMYHAERLGGALSLAAMKIPARDFDRVAGQVNALPEVAHNYEREHDLNMWFVLATETAQGQQAAIEKIERDTGYHVFNMPKLDEYFVELKFKV
ncbi:MAG TPA: AsnC family transcriptional regulator [Gallionellaceae bacterium]